MEEFPKSILTQFLELRSQLEMKSTEFVTKKELADFMAILVRQQLEYLDKSRELQ